MNNQHRKSHRLDNMDQLADRVTNWMGVFTIVLVAIWLLAQAWRVF